MTRALLPWVLGSIAAWGCASAGTTPETTGSGGSTITIGAGGSGATTTIGQGGAPPATGIPCDIVDLLSAHCWSCHGTKPSGGTTLSFVTRDQLAAPSKGDPSKSYAEVAITRMSSATSPMPPKPAAAVSSAEIAAFEAWVSAGLPNGTCGGGTGGAGGSVTGTGGADPYDTPVVCTSNQTWMNGDKGSDEMHPGKACKSCHVLLGKATGKTFDVSGTVFPTAHEPDDCNGTSVAGAKVVITDGAGQEHTLDVNGVGNFYHLDFFGFGAFPLPYKAKVVYNGKERVMNGAQMSGDCNSCHTEAGTSNAPGRIMLP